MGERAAGERKIHNSEEIRTVAKVPAAADTRLRRLGEPGVREGIQQKEIDYLR